MHYCGPDKILWKGAEMISLFTGGFGEAALPPTWQPKRHSESTTPLVPCSPSLPRQTMTIACLVVCLHVQTETGGVEVLKKQNRNTADPVIGEPHCFKTQSLLRKHVPLINLFDYRKKRGDAT